MLVRIPQLTRVGRFTRWDSQAARADTARFRRLTLIFGRNGSGKSTIVRTCIAASTRDATEIELDRTLESAMPPEVTLEMDHGVCRFDGKAWAGTPPKVVVFDRRFIEANVYIGRRSTKEHRKELLRLALGAEDVAHARELDDLTSRGRALALERNPHDATITSAARTFQLSPENFVALPAVEDAGLVRAALELKLKEAYLADEIAKRPQPTQLPSLPLVDFKSLQNLLLQDSTPVGEDVAKLVRAHLNGRLKGNGDSWIRAGLAHVNGATCPFCDQSLEGNELAGLYSTWFDRAYDQLVATIDLELLKLERLSNWWRDVKDLGRSNLRAFSAWSDLPGVQAPALDSTRRQAELDAVVSSLQELLAAKRQHPTRPIQSVRLGQLETMYASTAAAVHHYNSGLNNNRLQIKNRLAELGQMSADAIRRDLRRIDASIQRHSAATSVAISERARLDAELEQVRKSKEAAGNKMDARKRDRLASFSSRINGLLAMLCADFQLEELGTERVGGATGVRFTLRVEAGCFQVASAESEEQLARVLSDGDRSTLAFAIFLLSLDELRDLDDYIVVFDDPMTSQDAQRTEATAEQVSKLATRAKQVIVLSHHSQFLNQVAYDWRRHQKGRGHELVELELDKGTRSLRAWSADDHLQNEHIRRIADIDAFVTTPGPDRLAPRMQGEIRKLLEGHVRLSYPNLYQGASSTLEPVIAKLKTEELVRQSTRWSVPEIDELERLCAFGARGNHDASGLRLEAPSPEQVRSMARRALTFIRLGLPV